MIIVAVEGERLRRLRERVEAQELKLRRLRALRGQLDRNKQANIALKSLCLKLELFSPMYPAMPLNIGMSFMQTLGQKEVK
ncbi:hypothetical protein SFRURICE_018672 [Spodoptera frugiperda]|nr:hypothetical protein SFRURICE_018672 [Spodoptera frugiperda]